MKHAFDPRIVNTPVHLMALDGTMSLCTHAYTVKYRNGIAYQALYDIAEPATCKSCLKALQMAARVMLNDLDFIQTEQVIDFIVKLRKEKNGKHTS